MPLTGPMDADMIISLCLMQIFRLHPNRCNKKAGKIYHTQQKFLNVDDLKEP